MTKAQEIVVKYLDMQGTQDGSVRAVGDYIVEVDQNGTTARLTVNLFGDIMNADTKEIIAECDVPHNLDVLAKDICQEPKSWTRVKK